MGRTIGGKSGRITLASIKTCRLFLTRIIRAAWNDDLDAAKARVLIYGVQTVLQALAQEADTEVQARLAALEADAARKDGRHEV